jgi:hypothetical protein
MSRFILIVIVLILIPIVFMLAPWTPPTPPNEWHPLTNVCVQRCLSDSEFPDACVKACVSKKENR